MKSHDTSFILSPAWTIVQTGNALVVSGGADARYEIELEADKPSFFAGLAPDKPFTKRTLEPADFGAFEQLLAADIIAPVLAKATVLRAALLGEAKILRLTNSRHVSFVAADKPHDLAIVVRTGSTYAELLAKMQYEKITKPHLFVDLAFHHTLSIGPLVFPGETACIACLQGRVTTRWGDDVPPKVPHMTSKYGGVAAELLTVELERIAGGDTSLVSNTYAWNLQDRTVKKSLLLKVPLCPICNQSQIDRSGALALPWKIDESAPNTI